MANFKFEGEVDGISERQMEFVSSVLLERGFSDTKVLISAVGKADDNLGANVKRFVVEKDGETFKMIAKVAPTSEVVRGRFNTKLLFLNEHVIYTRVFPKFTELENGANVPESERFRYVTCYGSLAEEPNEIILLEDLEISNFVMLDKTKAFTDETVKLVLKNIARFHSLSYVLKNQEPDTYLDFKNKLPNNWSFLLNNEEWKPVLNQVDMSTISMLDNAKHKNVALGSASRLPLLARKNYNIDKDSKYSVIQHGDCWTNNILFKLEENKTVECCIIDYQLANESSPVADLHYMLFFCTNYETRSKHYHEWIDYYHAQLDMSLSNFGRKANFIYPRDQLDADLQRFGKYSFGLALTQTNILLVDTQKAAQIKEAMENKSNEMEAVFNLTSDKNLYAKNKSRVLGLINSFLELGYL